MIELIRTDSGNSDFIKLAALLDKELAFIDGEEHGFYDQFNKIDAIKYVLLAFEEGEAVGCGAIKELSPNAMEIKRMYVLKDQRGKGIASKIVIELENWTKELGFQKCRLETGKKQVDAIALYVKNKYQIIPNYGQYIGIENSVCFEKNLL
ncbi:MAG: GNAT family N-acetyltransferase [Bacteroidia bacterium]|nr:GNAT family N-acetyltransferase [Bacteroidia bacterium]MCF8446780.1 GNAT family N-acetyltransferase [Bacteroidia bacterium]